MLPVGCATQAELRGLSIVYVQPKVSMNLSNYEKPAGIELGMDKIFTIGDNIYQTIIYPLTTTEIEDRSDFLAGTKSRGSMSLLPPGSSALTSRDSTQIACTMAEVFNRVCVPYLTFRFTSSGTKTKITRTYKGIIKTLSEIGGISSFILAICFQISQIYNYFMKNKIIVRHVFPFLRSKKLLKNVAADIAARQPMVPNSYVRSPDDPIQDKTVFKEAKKEVEKIEGAALDLISNSLDIISILNEINNIRFLVNSLLKGHQQKLIPLVAIGLQREVNEKRPRAPGKLSLCSKTTIKPSTTTLDKVNHYELEITPDESYSQILDSLRENRVDFDTISSKGETNNLAISEIATNSILKGAYNLLPAFCESKINIIGTNLSSPPLEVINDPNPYDLLPKPRGSGYSQQPNCEIIAQSGVGQPSPEHITLNTTAIITPNTALNTTHSLIFKSPLSKDVDRAPSPVVRSLVPQSRKRLIKLQNQPKKPT